MTFLMIPLFACCLSHVDRILVSLSPDSRYPQDLSQGAERNMTVDYIPYLGLAWQGREPDGPMIAQSWWMSGICFFCLSPFLMLLLTRCTDLMYLPACVLWSSTL